MNAREHVNAREQLRERGRRVLPCHGETADLLPIAVRRPQRPPLGMPGLRPQVPGDPHRHSPGRVMADITPAEVRELLDTHFEDCAEATENDDGWVICHECSLILRPKHAGADVHMGVNEGSPAVVAWQHRVIVPRFPLRRCGLEGCSWRPFSSLASSSGATDAVLVELHRQHLVDTHRGAGYVRMWALTLWQPWVSLIADGCKTTETRSWRAATGADR